MQEISTRSNGARTDSAQKGSIAGATTARRRIGSLRDFLALLAEHRQCITWPEEVMPEPDIRNISVAAGNDVASGPAVLFDRIKGYPGRKVVVGGHATWANIALLLGHPKTATIKEMFFDMAERWGVKGAKPELNWIKPEDAPVHEVRVEKDINLYDLIPLYRINEYDGGFYMGKAAVVSRDPRDPEDFNKQNIGIYRLQAHGPRYFSLMTIPAHDIGRQILIAQKDGRPFRISVMLGNHPAIAMFAATPLAYDESEFAHAAAMMGQPIELTQSGNGMDVLAQSEFVIEAELVHGERVLEGPFGEFPGSYSGVRRAPLFKVTAVSHRRDPIFENIYIGRGWTEHDTLIGLSTSVPIYSVLKEQFPEVVAVNALYHHGMSAVISLKNRYGGFARSVALRALGTPHGLMYLKNIIMVDEYVDPFDLNQVMWAISVRTRASDIIVLPNMAMVPIDPAAEVAGKGHHLIIDATSYMPPDIVGPDVKLVNRPSGPEIEELGRRIRAMQENGDGR